MACARSGAPLSVSGGSLVIYLRGTAWVAPLAATVTTIPLFIDLRTWATNFEAFLLRSTPEMAQPLHTAVALPLLLLSLRLLSKQAANEGGRVRPIRNPLRVLMVVSLVALSVNVVYAVTFARGLSSPDRYLQSLLVVAPLALAGSVRIDPKRFLGWLMGSTCGGIVLILAYIARNSSLSELSGDGRIEVAYSFPQYLVYLPFLSVIAVAASVVARSQSAKLRAITMICGLAFFLVIWSRSTVILAIVAIVVSIVSSRSIHRSTLEYQARKQSKALRLLSVVLAIACVIAVSSSGVIGERATRSGANSGRAEIAREAAERILDSPVFGNGFTAQSPSKPKPFDTHNLYLELLMRGGLVGGLAAIIGLLVVLSELRRTAFLMDAWIELRAISTALFVAALLGGFSNPYLLQPFPGILVWFLVGTVLAARGSTHRQSGQSSFGVDCATHETTDLGICSYCSPGSVGECIAGDIRARTAAAAIVDVEVVNA